MGKVGRRAVGSDRDADPQAGGIRWPDRLAKIRIGRASKGTGWAIGATGILTTRSVVTPMIPLPDDAPAGEPAAAPAATAEIVLGASPERSFDARLVWERAEADLAILAITDRSLTTWKTLLRRSKNIPLAYLPAGPGRAVTLTGLAGRPGGSETSTVAWMLAPPDRATGLMTAAARGARAELDVGRKDLGRAAKRLGMPGAVVLATDPEEMVLGLATGKPHSRRSPRFEVATLPDPETDPEFAAALAEVGAGGAVIGIDGPILRRYLRDDCLDAALRPREVDPAIDPGFFGVKPARTDITDPGEPYFGWMSRPERSSLAGAIDLAAGGVGPRVIVLRGPSAAGKSRLAAEAIRTHGALHGYALLAPRAGASILDLPRRLLPPRSVLFVDNIGDLPATALTHDGVRTLLDDEPGLIVVATLTDLPEASGSARLVDSGQDRHSPGEMGADFPLAAASLSGVRTVIGDDTITRTIAVSPTPVWGRDDGGASRADWALARAKKQGLGLGEYLAGYHELADHYTAALWPTRALVDLVADWDRSGIGAPLPTATARTLWERLVPSQLPRDELRQFARLTPIEKEKRWRGALAYACTEIAGCASLVVRGDEGLLAGEFARVHIDQGAISAALWEYLIGEATTTPAQRVDLGLAALGSGTPRRALRAFESVLYSRDSDPVAGPRRQLLEVVARRGIAIYHARSHREEQAVMVYTDLVDTFGASDDPDIAEQVAQALLGIGLTFSQLGSHGQAVSAYTELVSRFADRGSPILAEYVTKALLGQATTLATLGRTEEARAAYADIVARCSDEPGAAVQTIVEIAQAALAGH